MAGTAVVPQGFTLDEDTGPAPSVNLPNAPGLEAWQETSAVPEGAALDIPPGGEAEIGTWSDGRPKIRRVAPDGTAYDGTYNDDGSWSAVAEITGEQGDGGPLSADAMEALPPAPEGFFYDEKGELQPEDVGDLSGQPEYTLPEVGAGGAAYHGATSGLMLGLDDEFKGGVAALANAAGRALGLNETDPNLSIVDLYRHFRDQDRNEKDAAYDQHPYAYGAGFVPGALLSAPFVGGNVARGETALATAGNLAGAGARAGGISGAGNSEDSGLGMLADAGQGALGGAVAAPVVAGAARYTIEPLIQKAAQVAGRLRSGEGVTGNAMNSGLEQLARRTEQDPEAMRQTAREFARAGVDARPVDVVDEQGRAVVRNAANKMTPAREDLRQHAEDVYAGMPDRVARQARENISDAPRTARQIGREIADEQRAMGPQFDAVRNEPVALTPEMIQAFSTADARSALRRIGRQMTASEQQQLNAFISSVNAAARQIDPRLPAPVRQQIERQLFANSPLTVDIADKFSRVLTKAAEDQPALMRVAQDYANTVRGAARQQYPDYDAALVEMSQRAGVADAAQGVGRRFENSDFLKSPQDEFARAVGEASPDPRAVANQEGAPTLSEMDALRMRARDDVVDRATAGTGAQAPSVARQLSRPGIAQAERSRALLGTEGAERLQRGMGAELRRYQNTQYIDPSAGSKSASVLGDEADMAGGVANMALNAKTGGIWSAVREASRALRNMGIRNVDAERLVRDAINPRRTQDAINYLERRGIERARARSLVRSISGALGGRAGGAASYDGPPDGPGQARPSVRSVLNREGRVDSVKGEK